MECMDILGALIKCKLEYIAENIIEVLDDYSTYSIAQCRLVCKLWSSHLETIWKLRFANKMNSAIKHFFKNEMISPSMCKILKFFEESANLLKSYKSIREVIRVLEIEKRWDFLGGTLFHLAAEIGNTEVVRLFLDLPKHFKFKPTRKVDDFTAFHLACFNGRTEVVKLLLKHPASQKINVNQLVMDSNGWCNHRKTPLMMACEHGHLEVVKILLDYSWVKNLNINLANEEGNTAVHHACGYYNSDEDQIKTIEYILGHPISENLDINATNRNGFTLLQNLVSYGKTEVVKQLLNHPKSVNLNMHICSNEDEQNVLHMLLEEGNCDGLDQIEKLRAILKALLQRQDFDFNIPDAQGMTPIHHACSRRASQALDIILDHKTSRQIDLNLRDSYGKTALHRLCSRPTFNNHLNQDCAGLCCAVFLLKILL